MDTQKLSVDGIPKLSILDSEFKEFLEQNGPFPHADFSDVEGCRAATTAGDEAMLDKLGPLESTMEEFSTDIPMDNGWKSHTAICRPRSKAGKADGPLIMLFYGGGFISGGPKTMAAYARGLARLFDATVVCPSCRPAPEHKFPAAIEDAWRALLWAANHTKFLRADPQKGFIVGGISSGANFAAVLSRMAAEKKLSPPLTGQWVSQPVLFRAYTVPGPYKGLWTSWMQNRDTMIINSQDGEILFGHYEPDFESPLFNPVAPGYQLGLMPPAYIQVCGRDLIRDDGLVYHKMLQDSGVPTRLDIYAGVPHSYWHFFPQLAMSQRAVLDIAKGFAWLLKSDLDTDRVPQAMWIPQLP